MRSTLAILLFGLCATTSVMAADKKTSPAPWPQEPNSFIRIKLSSAVLNELPDCNTFPATFSVKPQAHPLCHRVQPGDNYYSISGLPDLGRNIGYRVHMKVLDGEVQLLILTARANCYSELTAIFIAKYGPPSERAKQTIKIKEFTEYAAQELRWLGKSVDITLLSAESPKVAVLTPILLVSFKERGGEYTVPIKCPEDTRGTLRKASDHRLKYLVGRLGISSAFFRDVSVMRRDAFVDNTHCPDHYAVADVYARTDNAAVRTDVDVVTDDNRRIALVVYSNSGVLADHKVFADLHLFANHNAQAMTHHQPHINLRTQHDFCSMPCNKAVVYTFGQRLQGAVVLTG